ncbi:serine hydrolase domain-containing protein [Radiobacillus sp. PE A8.2]|uniref:serine hydrolase domain-containing protein n=1 Tax=Radiobacillus sp. PE A8.2 TaxID=3380349 RepID=UPI00388D7CF4
MDKFKRKLDEYLQDCNRDHDLHGSILVSYKGEIIINESFGMANYEHHIPNTPKTKFRIGSITKSFTAAAIFQLQQQGKLHIEEPISKYLPAFPSGDTISIYHCLTNSTGIVDFVRLENFWEKTMRLPASINEVIASVKDLPLQFAPGTKFGYSNTNYLILTKILEQVSGETYASYMKDHIFNPLQMHDTGCDDGVNIVEGLASGYTFDKKPKHAAYADLSFPLGAYGLYTTVEDLYKWDQALMTNELLSEASLKTMLEPYQVGYACGWAVSPIHGHTCWNHYGDISGYVNYMMRFPEEELTIVFLSNMDTVPVSTIGQIIAKLAFR